MAKEKSFGIAPYKIDNDKVFILMNKTGRIGDWNFFKGKIEDNEGVEDCAIREFFEETGIKVKNYQLEEFFFQKNKKKDIGIYLVNFTDKNPKFKFDKREIFFADWVLLTKDLCKNVSKNQREIWKQMKEYFTHIDEIDFKSLVIPEIEIEDILGFSK